MGQINGVLRFFLQLELNLKGGIDDPLLIDKFVGLEALSSSGEASWQMKLGILLGSRVVVENGRCDETFLAVLAPSG